jgi:hypothetical protein
MNATTGLDQSAIKEPSPRKDSRQKGGHMPPRCRSKGERRFIKRDRQSKPKDHAEDAATKEPAAGRTAT